MAFLKQSIPLQFCFQRIFTRPVLDYFVSNKNRVATSFWTGKAGNFVPGVRFSHTAKLANFGSSPNIERIKAQEFLRYQ